MITILHSLRNAKENLHSPNHLDQIIGIRQVETAIELLEAGNHPDACVEEATRKLEGIEEETENEQPNRRSTQ